jgi:NADH-ubiquinone oxidoreductase chain 4
MKNNTIINTSSFTHGQLVNEKSFYSYYSVGNSFGFDGISFFFIVLSAFLFFLCTLALYSFPVKNITVFFIWFSILQFFVLASFMTLNYLLFYICFETILIPMFIIIGVWGSRARKSKAANYFFFYSFVGSIFMLLGIFLIYFYSGSLN